MKTKIFAMYLPQFHEIPENSMFWGKGFTDWVTVKQSEPLFDGHIQPKEPLNGNYYDLSIEENVKWQAKLANEYGIDGFGIYHYWFNNEQNLLTKPSKIILDNKDIHINFFFVWDNASWKRTWSKVEGNDWSPIQDKCYNHDDGILIKYNLGNEVDWENHFNYLLTFFKDDRYEKVNNKPVFVIYNYSSAIEKMSNYWDLLSKKYGFDGIYFIYKYDKNRKIPREKNIYYYEPLHSGWTRFTNRVVFKLRKVLKISGIKKYSYDNIWKRIIRNAKKDNNNNLTYGVFVNYDDSPRRGNRGRCVVGGTPIKFENYMKKIMNICKKKEKRYLFLTAWNEWGEGAYLEPDNIDRYSYLECIKKIVKSDS